MACEAWTLGHSKSGCRLRHHETWNHLQNTSTAQTDGTTECNARVAATLSGNDERLSTQCPALRRMPRIKHRRAVRRRSCVARSGWLPSTLRSPRPCSRARTPTWPPSMCDAPQDLSHSSHLTATVTLVHEYEYSACCSNQIPVPWTAWKAMLSEMLLCYLVLLRIQQCGRRSAAVEWPFLAKLATGCVV